MGSTTSVTGGVEAESDICVLARISSINVVAVCGHRVEIMDCTGSNYNSTMMLVYPVQLINPRMCGQDKMWMKNHFGDTEL